MPSQPSARRPVKTAHPGIYKKGNRYIDTWKERGRPRSKSYPTITAAKRGRAERIAWNRAPSSRQPFDEYARRWLDTYQGRSAKGIGATTRATYRHAIEDYAIPYFRRTPLGDIDKPAVKRYIEHLVALTPARPIHNATHLGPRTIRGLMVPLKILLAEAHELALIPTDAGRVRIIVPDEGREQHRAPKTLTTEQIDTVLAALPATYRPLFVLLADTGLRISEALGLQWRDLEQTPDGPKLAIRRQFFRGELQDTVKTDAGARRVALMPTLARELIRRRASTEHAADSDPIFSTKRGTHISAHNIRRVLRAVTEPLDMTWATPHTFRHSFATAMRDAGYDAHDIAKVLGHTDPDFTRRVYIHAVDSPRFDALDGRFGNR